MAKTALVVEDEEVLREPMTRLFKREGYEADEAATLQEAKQCLETKVYDICLSDGSFPDKPDEDPVGGNGFRLYEYLKEKYPATRFILFTGDKDSVKEAKRRGMEAYHKDDYTIVFDLIKDGGE